MEDSVWHPLERVMVVEDIEVVFVLLVFIRTVSRSCLNVLLKRLISANSTVTITPSAPQTDTMIYIILVRGDSSWLVCICLIIFIVVISSFVSSFLVSPSGFALHLGFSHLQVLTLLASAQ